jgi:hypothetical protein
MRSPSAMGELLPSRQDGDNRLGSLNSEVTYGSMETINLAVTVDELCFALGGIAPSTLHHARDFSGLARCSDWPPVSRRLCAKSFLRRHCYALSRRAQKQEPMKQEPSIITAATLGVPLHGAGGTCAVRWAAIRARSTTSRKRGLTTARMLVVRPLA